MVMVGWKTNLSGEPNTSFHIKRLQQPLPLQQTGHQCLCGCSKLGLSVFAVAANWASVSLWLKQTGPQCLCDCSKLGLSAFVVIIIIIIIIIKSFICLRTQ